MIIMGANSWNASAAKGRRLKRKKASSTLYGKLFKVIIHIVCKKSRKKSVFISNSLLIKMHVIRSSVN